MDKKTTFREAIKIGLATVITYYIAMRMGWMNPTWAAIAVGMISLPTAGQSINKGILRMGGTLIAFVAGLFFLGLYPQSRWLFFLSLTPFLGFVAYKVAGTKDQYFWFVIGFVTLMICTAGSGTSASAFQFAAFRTLETLMGIVVWTLISVFIWPRSNLIALKTVSKDLLENQTKLVGQVSASLQSTDFNENETINSLLSSIRKSESDLDEILKGAASENHDVAQLRVVWSQFQQGSISIYENLDKINDTSNDLRAVNLSELIPNLIPFLQRIETRFENSAQLLAGSAKELLHEDKQIIDLSVDKKYTDPKDYYQSVVIASLTKELIQLDSLSVELLNYIYQLTGIKEWDLVPKATFSETARTTGFLRFLTLDPDRVRASVMVVISMWVGALIWIYVNPPGHISWFQFLPNLTLIVSMAPQVRFAFFKPMVYAYIVGLVVYVFLMPQLTMFWQLGLIIMAFTFTAAYIFTNSAMRMALYMALYNMLGIQNDQSYDFASQINSVTFTLTAILVTVGLSYIMRTPRQEKMFLSMAHRFFVACDFINDRSLKTSAKASFLNKLKTVFYMKELRTLPGKMTSWGAQIDPVNFPNNSSVQITAIVSDLKMMALRLEDLYKARQLSQSPYLLDKLKVDFLKWYDIIQRGFVNWSEPLKTISDEQYKKQVIEYANYLVRDIKEVTNEHYQQNISKKEKENLYQLVTCMTGLSDSAIAFSTTFGKTDWEDWNKEVFS